MLNSFEHQNVILPKINNPALRRAGRIIDLNKKTRLTKIFN
jgi:hypothetical protein